MGRFDLNVLRPYMGLYQTIVETGTLRGDGTAVMAENFDHVHTIELSADLHAKAEKRFAEQKHVQCHCGDSKDILRALMPVLPPDHTVFFLDAHWSGDSSVKWDQCEYYNPDNTAYVGDQPTSRNQVPLHEEIHTIVHCYRGPCLIYIDDMDKFDEKGYGRKNFRFPGEDWSHLHVNHLKGLVQSRQKAWFTPSADQALIELNPLE
jgi:hypothetical protein